MCSKLNQTKPNNDKIKTIKFAEGSFKKYILFTYLLLEMLKKKVYFKGHYKLLLPTKY